MSRAVREALGEPDNYLTVKQTDYSTVHKTVRRVIGGQLDATKTSKYTKWIGISPRNIRPPSGSTPYRSQTFAPKIVAYWHKAHSPQLLGLSRFSVYTLGLVLFSWSTGIKYVFECFSPVRRWWGAIRRTPERMVRQMVESKYTALSIYQNEVWGNSS